MEDKYSRDKLCNDTSTIKPTLKTVIIITVTRLGGRIIVKITFKVFNL